MTITYNSHPYGLLTYTSPSNKLVRKSDGLFKFSAHNLYLNSAAPANQSITVVSGATYSVTITGSVSVTASGAATGTWTAGTNTFTSAATTLTLGSTSGSGTVHVRRTPSDSLYLETAGTARFALPFEWSTAGALLGIRVEPAATNSLTDTDFSTAVAGTPGTAPTNWPFQSSGGTTTIATSTLLGVGNRPVFAATGARQFIGQSITFAPSTTYTLSAWVNVLATDASLIPSQILATSGIPAGATGTYYVDGVVSAAQVPAGLRFIEYVVTVAGTGGASAFRLGAGCVDVCTGTVQIEHAQMEIGAHARATSPIITYSASVTRAADQGLLPGAAFPLSGTVGTLYMEAVPLGAGVFEYLTGLSDGSTNNFAGIRSGISDYRGFVRAGAVDQAAVLTGAIRAVGTTVKIAVAFASNDVRMAAGGVLGTPDTSAILPTLTQLNLMSHNAVTAIPYYLRKVIYVPRAMSNAELQTLTT